ncbi:argininosuccinate synthase [Candidatus Rariloculus sp.]|uniref:argininosuccinate synthase n=1 Tax=Candidatus Rariloculus sp. TaxID=3101265 RepID=UPI003D1198A5
MTTSNNGNPIVLAFSGGLDTSFCIPWLKETHGRPVVTVTVNTGGIDSQAATELTERALALGAADHVLLEAREEFFNTVLKYLIMGNVRRGQLYPLCVGAERGVQASHLARFATDLDAASVAHGCTAAGNDQVRFEIILKALAPELEVLAPVRDHSWARAAQVEFLEQRGMPTPLGGSAYSINRGLWGVTIGGTETLDSKGCIPESAWVLSRGALDAPRAPLEVELGFECGIPTAIDGARLDAVTLIEQLESIGKAYAIGRGIHLGDTIIGTKGRVAFEAPAAEILIAAHRELEKLTLSAMQSRVKEQLGQIYGDLIHEGRQLDPVCADIETLLDSSQSRVTGTVRCLLRPGSVFVLGTDSPHSLMAASRGKYGESAGEWTSADALGFSRILSLPGMLHTRARGD